MNVLGVLRFYIILYGILGSVLISLSLLHQVDLSRFLPFPKRLTEVLLIFRAASLYFPY